MRKPLGIKCCKDSGTASEIKNRLGTAQLSVHARRNHDIILVPLAVKDRKNAWRGGEIVEGRFLGRRTMPLSFDMLMQC